MNEIPKNRFLRRVHYFFNKPSYLELFMLFDQLSDYTAAGIEQTQTFTKRSQSEENLYLRAAFKTISEKLVEGADIHIAFAATNTFEDIVISSIESGVIAGNLEIQYENLAEIYAQKADIVSRVNTALIIPKIGFSISAFGLVILKNFILPKYKIIFEQNNITFPEILLLFEKFIDVILFLVPTAILTFLFAMRFLKNNKKYSVFRRKISIAWDTIKLKSPIFGELYFLYLQYLTAINIAILLKSAIPLSKAINQTAKTISSPVLSRALYLIEEDVNTGHSLSFGLENQKETFLFKIFGQKVFNLKKFSYHIINFAETGEATGSLDKQLLSVSRSFNKHLKSILPAKEQALAFISLSPLVAIVAFMYLLGIIPALSFMDQLSK